MGLCLPDPFTHAAHAARDQASPRGGGAFVELSPATSANPHHLDRSPFVADPRPRRAIVLHTRRPQTHSSVRRTRPLEQSKRPPCTPKQGARQVIEPCFVTPKSKKIRSKSGLDSISRLGGGFRTKHKTAMKRKLDFSGKFRKSTGRGIYVCLPKAPKTQKKSASPRVRRTPTFLRASPRHTTFGGGTAYFPIST